MQKYFFTLLIVLQLVPVSKLFSQNIALNATGSLPDTSAMLDVSSSNKGFLLPRMNAAQVTAIPLPATGLIVFNTTVNAFQVNKGTPANPTWETLGTTVGNWLTNGNGGTNSGSKFIGTTDSVSLRFRTNNTQRIVFDSLGNVGIGTSPSFVSGTNVDKFLVDAGITKSYNVVTAKGTVNNYLQFNVQNLSSGSSGSSDLVATADNGNETSNFVNMGINGSGNTDGTMGGADDAYLFNMGNNLLLGACSSSKAIVFVTGSTSQATNERMRIDGTGKVGIGTSAPGSALDVKGTLRLSGATSGYIGFTPAAVAGSTTYTLPADGTSGQQLTTNGAGVLSWASSGGSTTHTLTSSGNIVTSTVNGIAVTANAVNAVANTSTTNTLTTTINGVAGTGVNIINSNTTSLSGANLTTTVNGVSSTALDLTPAINSVVWKSSGNMGTNAATNFIGTGDAVDFVTKTSGTERMRISSTGNIGIGTTAPGSPLDIKGALRLSGSTSGYVGFTPAAAAGSTTYTLPTADGTTGQQLTTNGSGVLSWAASGGSTTHTLTSSSNVVTSTVNGVAVTANTVNTVANTSTTNTLTTTINGVAGTGVNIINSNATALSGTNLTITVNGLASTALDLTPAISSVAWKSSGNSGTSASTNFIGTSDAIDFVTKTNGIERMRISSTGNIGIGTNAPGSPLDVKGTLRLSGSTSGYVGFTPAAAAGSTTYTLPTADGTNGQQLTTNGSGTLSWTSAGSGSGWGLTGNSGTSASSNYIGTSDNTDVVFKRSNTAAGTLEASSTSFGVSSSAASTQASAFGATAAASGNASIAIGYDASSTMANSISMGATSYVQPGSGSTDDIAIGYGANVSGGSAFSYSTAIGSGAQVQASNALAIGKSSVVSTQYGISIGDASQAQGTSAVVLGANAYANGVSSIAIGGGAAANKTQAQGTYSISLGYNAYSSSQDAIAIGDHAQAQGTNTTVIGTGIYNGTSNTVAIGNSSITSFLMNGASAGSSKAIVVGTSSSNGNGAFLTTGGTWTNASDRNLKDDFSTIDGEEVLNKISKMDITRWKYKGTNEYHVGPMAQDFYQSFKLGNDDKHISTIDPSGIALVSIKALKEENIELNKKLDAQQLLIEQLQKSLEEIKTKLR